MSVQKAQSGPPNPANGNDVQLIENPGLRPRSHRSGLAQETCCFKSGARVMWLSFVARQKSSLRRSSRARPIAVLFRRHYIDNSTAELSPNGNKGRKRRRRVKEKLEKNWTQYATDRHGMGKTPGTRLALLQFALLWLDAGA